MRQVIHGSPKAFEDARTLVRTLTGARTPLSAALRGFLPAGRDVFVTRAPLRATLAGGPWVPPGCVSLLAPLGASVCVALQRSPTRRLAVRQLTGDHRPGVREIEVPLHFLEAGERPVRPDVVRAWFARHDHRAWFAPVAGTLLAVMRELGIRFGDGLRIAIWSPVPAGQGLGVTAAMSIALLRAVFADANFVAAPRELVRVARQMLLRAEPAPTAATPWAAATAGHPSTLLAQAAQPQLAPQTLPLDHAVTFWVIGLEPADERPVRLGQVVGRLATSGFAEIERALEGTASTRRRRAFNPADLDDEEFAARFSDLVTDEPVQEPDLQPGQVRHLSPRLATTLVVSEQVRLRTLLAMWPSLDEDQRAQSVGALMTTAHEAWQAAGATTAGADAIVASARALAPSAGVLGARTMPGARAVVVATRGPEATALSPLIETPVAGTRHQVVATGSSPGAVPFGYVRLRG